MYACRGKGDVINLTKKKHSQTGSNEGNRKMKTRNNKRLQL